uniref:Uncharacterized protein n=1 Tax=Fibrocapsa japonica TaxID=94617 RepID=A0A7S2V995_9STRA|mmetsp:Transcript_914/g.1321  ORF Transcript_914/g.1321 Transcript_914/m.1321 type:complete len:244 (+) Transcript_914:72-803(+)
MNAMKRAKTSYQEKGTGGGCLDHNLLNYVFALAGEWKVRRLLSAKFQISSDKQIKEIKFSRKTPHATLTNLTSKLTCLKKLILSQVESVNDDVVRQVLKNCPDLVYLDLAFCQGITESSLFYAHWIQINIAGCWEQFRPSPLVPAVKVVEVQLRALKASRLQCFAQSVADSFSFPGFDLWSCVQNCNEPEIKWDACTIRPFVMKGKTSVFYVKVGCAGTNQEAFLWYLSQTPMGWMTRFVDAV